MEEIVKRVKIKEFIDQQLNLIGNDDEPTTGPDMETEVGTAITDKNAGIAHQDFDYDFNAKFGFGLWENTDKNNPLLKELAELIYNKSDEKKKEFSSLSENDQLKKSSYGIANEIMEVFKKHIKEVGFKQNKLETNKLSESELKKVIEDIVLFKKDTPLAKKTDKDVLSKTITDKIDKMSKDDKELLIKYIKNNK